MEKGWELIIAHIIKLKRINSNLQYSAISRKIKIPRLQIILAN